MLGCLWIGAGCGSSRPLQPPTLPGVQWKAHPCGLLTSISASKTDVYVGEPVSFTFRVFNPTRKSMQIPAFKNDSAHLSWHVMESGRGSYTSRQGTCDELRSGELQSQTITEIADHPGKYTAQAWLNADRKVPDFEPLETFPLQVNVRTNAGIGVNVSWNDTDFVEYVERIACRNVTTLISVTTSPEEDQLCMEARRILLSPERRDVTFVSKAVVDVLRELHRQYGIPYGEQGEEGKSIPASLTASLDLKNVSFAEALAAICSETGLIAANNLLALYEESDCDMRQHCVGNGNYLTSLRFFRIGRNLHCFVRDVNPIRWFNASACSFRLEHVKLSNGARHTTQSEDDAKEGCFSFPVSPEELDACNGKIAEIRGTVTVLVPVEVRRRNLDPRTMSRDQEIVLYEHFIRVGQGDPTRAGSAEPTMGVYCNFTVARSNAEAKGISVDIGSVVPLDATGKDMSRGSMAKFRDLKSMYLLRGKMPARLVWTFCTKVETLQIPVAWHDVAVPKSAYQVDDMRR